MLDVKNNRFYYILLSTIVILTDQLTKYVINGNYKEIINRDFIIFSLDYIKNYGAAFNLFSGNRIFLSILSIVISIFLMYCIIYRKNISYTDLLGYSFILGGTIGNGYDRITKGYVIDFINLNFINFAIFNIADISINVGFILIIYGLIKHKR